MTTDLAVPSSTVDVPGMGGDLLAGLQRWAQCADVAHELAKRMVVTSFTPRQYQNKPAEGAVAILAGAEVGLSPIAALKAFDVIEGTAAAKAITLRAIVQSRGHAMWEVEVSDERVIVRGHRKGEADKVRESEWTIARAERLGLAGKDNWKKQPRACLLYTSPSPRDISGSRMPSSA